MSFRQRSEKIISKGLTAPKATSLADMHRRRQETQSQYFTPAWVARGIWSSLSNITEQAISANKLINVIDSSCGSGRLFEGAPVNNAVLYGLDKDPNCINTLIDDTKNLEIDHCFESGCISELDYHSFDIAVINPAYSIHLENPNLCFYDTNSFGRFGPGTSAKSHEYALAQAISGASTVAALLPISAEPLARSFKRLSAIIHLPANTFTEEGANVKTAVFFFGSSPSAGVQEYAITKNDQWPTLPMSLDRYRTRPSFKLKSYTSTTPTIDLPVTHNRRVELHHHNRRIVVKYHCGLVKAKVHNALLQGKAEGKRLPKTISFAGDGALLLDVMLMQDEPDRQIDILAGKIKRLGGEAWISPTLKNYYRKLVKRHQRASTPFYRQVLKANGGNTITLRAKKRTLLNPEDFNSPSIKKDQFIKATPTGEGYILTLNDCAVTLRRDEMLKRFEIVTKGDIEEDKKWGLLHEGLNSAFPDIATSQQKRITAHGIDWLADFQRDSLTEGLINPYGYIGAWQQGSGKARYSIALALLHSGKNLIVVEPGLLAEMIIELDKIGLCQSLWGVLEKGDTPTKKVNFTTYPTLRAGTKIHYIKETVIRSNTENVPVTKIVRTSAERWKRMFNTVICDEGSVLANLNTQQTKAVKTLSAKKLIVLDGTPQRNYPRDLLPLSVATAGNGMAHQVYGVKGKPLLETTMVGHSHGAQRGEDAFYDNHVVTEWVTNEFKEDLQAGGKREIPKINNLSVFRDWLSPNIQRRLRAEPDLKAFQCPEPNREVIGVGWDKEHLAHYIKTATEFANWYKQNTSSGKNLSMVAALAKIQAVQRAANSPHVISRSSLGTYTPLTSKQRAVIDRIAHYVRENKKVVLYAHSPDVLERLHVELNKINIDSVLYTGKQNINSRAEALNNQFRCGRTNVLLSSYVGQRGLNLEQASAVIFYERNWSATNEEQAIYRLLRPSQSETINAEYFHLPGSIDEYCTQLVDFKKSACEAGLDFGEGATEDEVFLHLDTILSRFCDDVYSMSAYELKDTLCA